MRNHRLLLAIVAGICVLAWLGMGNRPAYAGDTILSNNTGDSSTTWFISGEPTLVMNGFDLGPLNLSFPVTMDAVSINVSQPVPGSPVQVVIYEDSNGGSPADASLVYQTEVTISTAGSNRITLPEPPQINAPVVWVGFYLPVDFEFFADESGTSVLTYWGWTPGTTFDLSNLGSPQVFGPSDGSAPVNIDLGGVARISAELVTDGTATTVTPNATPNPNATPAPNATPVTRTGVNDQGVPIGQQIAGGNADLSVMDTYGYCGERLLFDPADVDVTANRTFTVHCRADLGTFSPGQVINEDELPAAVPSYERRGFFYEIFGNGDYAVPGSSEKLRVPVTHCLRPEQGELNAAVVGVAYGAPRAWEILPTVRYNEWVCAEVTHTGFLSYFVPRTGNEPYENIDLYFSGDVELVPFASTGGAESFLCGYRYTPEFAIRNEGFEDSPDFQFQIRVTHDRTGTVSKSKVYTLQGIEAGETDDFSLLTDPFIMPTIYVGESHTFRFIIDPSNNIVELNDSNNVFQIPSRIVRITGRCD